MGQYSSTGCSQEVGSAMRTRGRTNRTATLAVIAPGGVAEDGADRQSDQAHQGGVDALPDHGPQHVVVVERDVGEGWVGGDHGVPDEEVDEAHHFGHDEDEDHKDDHLGHEHPEPSRRGQQASRR